MQLKEKIMQTMIELVSVPGIAGTVSENLTSDKIVEIFQGMTYFQKHPENLMQVKLEKDYLGRSFVAAIFKSIVPSNKTVIITGHFDVVGIDEFGHLKDIAFDAVEFTKRVSELKLNNEALLDLNSGDWIFGRGTADMKYGIALGIELIRYYSENEDFVGNILFLGVPGEESNSEGMLGAVPFLLELKEKLQLNYEGLMVSECCFPKTENDNGKRIYLGTCGKIMPLFFFAGRESHVGESYTSFNPNLLASELNRLLELNVNFCQRNGDNTTPPPTCLKQIDLKELYSVQVPLFAAAYYNLQTLDADLENITEALKDIAYEAFNNVIEINEKNIDRYEKVSGNKVPRLNLKPLVITYYELYNKVKELYGEEFDLHLDKKIKELQKQDKDIQTIAIAIVKETYEWYPDKKPQIIIGFAPPYYPDKHLNSSSYADMKLLNAVDETIRYAEQRYNIFIQKEDYFMGLCDLSYTGLSEGKNIDKISNNVLGLSKTYNFPADELKKLNIPSIVFGGFGKDFHKYTERLNISYSFDIVPDLYEFLIHNLTGKK